MESGINQNEIPAGDGDYLESLFEGVEERHETVLHLRDEAAEQVRRYDVELGKLERVLAVRDDGTGVDPVATGSASPGPMRQPKPDDPLAEAKDLTGLAVDLSGAKNLVERIVKIALADKTKVLNLTQLSHCIMRNGGSGGSLTSVRRQVSRELKGNPGLFEPIATATYRYIGQTAQQSTGATNPGSLALWQGPRPYEQEVNPPGPR